MKQTHKIASQFFGLFLSLAILFPSIFQFVHAFEEHEHKVCDEITTHLHEQEVECDLHDFQLTPSHFQLTAYPEFKEEVKISSKIIVPHFFLSSEEIITYYLRGPPTIQQRS